MKLQHLTILFVIIILPISLVMGQYLQTQIDTIVLQAKYNNSLINATTDALKAYQLNTINNRYSSISDSKIRDVEASINTFYKSLGTSMGNYVSTKQELSSYIPAIVYTLYDGYYIYSPYNNVYSEHTVEEEEPPTVSIKTGNADPKNYQQGLRPYIYYSAQYNLNGNRIVINYTLDNYITVYGDVGNGYQVRSGYLIDYENVELESGIYAYKNANYNGVTIKGESLQEYLITIDSSGNSTESDDYYYITYKNQKIYKDDSNGYFRYDNYKKKYLQGDKAELDAYLNDKGIDFYSTSAVDYYYEAVDFSKWVYSKLKDLTVGDMVASDETKAKIGNENTKIFYDLSTIDPMSSSSNFNNHRLAIIRDSIETNLATVMANYTKGTTGYEYAMPVLDEEKWYNIANNVSIITFMQGIPMKTKYFNNYCVLANTKNEEFVSDESIYFFVDGEYHRFNCPKLNAYSNTFGESVKGYNVLSTLRQTVKISDNNSKYFYPHHEYTACYHCIVNNEAGVEWDNLKYSVKTEYLTALAREKYDLYKSNDDLKKE